MPIRGLTEEVRMASALPKIATIYKGGEKRERQKDGRKYEIMGEDLPYFRVEFDPYFEPLREIFEQLYGDKPEVFPNVRLVGETTNEAFSSWKEEWNTSETLLIRCDGESINQRWNPNAGVYVRAKTPCLSPEGKPKACGCEAVGRLSIMLMDFMEATGAIGTFTLSTHSLNDIITLFNRIKFAEGTYTRVSSLPQIPFELGRKPTTISVPNPKDPSKRMKVTKSLLYLEVDKNFARENIGKLLSPAALALPSGVPETIELEEVPVDEQQRAEETKRAMKALGGGKRVPIGRSEPPPPSLPDDIPDADYGAAEDLEPLVIPHTPPSVQALMMTKAVFIAMSKKLLGCKDAELRANLAKYFNRAQLAAIFEGVDTDYDSAYRELEANIATL